jgi:outer membrane biosynthesis protein TonB
MNATNQTFAIAARQSDNSIRSKSIALSVLIHGALLLALILYVMNIKIPPFPESGGGGGVLVNIGYVDLSTGVVQPMTPTTTTNPVPEKVPPAPQSKQPDLITQDNEVTAAVNAIKKHEAPKSVVKTTTPITIKETKKPVETPREADPRALYKGNNTSTSQGTSNSGSRDEGRPDGDPRSMYKGGSGTGSGPGSGGGQGGGIGTGQGPGAGPGFSFSLSGRSLLMKPSVDDRSQETGKVVVDISVDRNGNVVDASPYGRGSTNVSAYLRGKAKEGAMKAKFSPNPNGPDVQKGTMTFVFLVQ